MKVKLRHFEFDTDEMSRYSTGVTSMPFIFVNENGTAFMETTRQSWATAKVRHLFAR